MYTLVGAKHRQDRQNGRWVDVDLTSAAIHNLNTVYGDVWLFITYPSLTEPKALRFDRVANQVVGEAPSVTVPQWLTAIGTLTLPFADEFPGFTPTYVEYTEAWHAGYDIQPIKRGGAYNPVGSRYDKEDLIVRRADMDPELLYRHAMFSVNGFFHLTDYNANGLYVREGNKTVVKSNDNQVGVYSFLNIAPLSFIPITAEMVKPQTVDAPLKRGMYITLPETVELNGKTPLLVFGGYLHLISKEFMQVGERTFKIDPLNINLLDRYYDSFQSLDLSSLNLPMYDDHLDLVEVEPFFADETLLAYATLDQSFIVLVDIPYMFQEFIPLDQTGLPGRYYDYEHRLIPVSGSYGRMVEHHRILEEGVSVVAGCRNVRYNRDYNHTNWQEQLGVDAGNTPSAPFYDDVASLRLIGVEK